MAPSDPNTRSERASDSDQDEPPLEAVLDQLEETAAESDSAENEDARVSIGEIVDDMGEKSFPGILLVPSLIMVSPVSGIPGSPTVSGVLYILIAGQALWGRETLWLPDFLRKLSIPVGKFGKAVQMLRKPVGWIDPLIKERLSWLTTGIAAKMALLTCVLVALATPPMELLPFAASFAAGTVAMLATGLLARDGVFILLGYANLAGVIALVLWLL